MILCRRVPGSWRLSDVSAEAATLLGCSREKWLEPGFLEARAVGALSDDCEVRLRRDDGRHVWVRVLFDGDTGVLVDVSARRRLEMVGRLLSGIAHELNTPVQFVSDNLGFVRDAVGDLLPLLEKYRALREALASGRRPSASELTALAELESKVDTAFLADELPRATEESRKGLERVAAMVKALWEFASGEEVVAVDVNRAVQTALTFARHEYKYVADVFTNFGVVPQVVCHAGELNQALLDLLLDAAKVAKDEKPRGRIDVSTRVEASDVVVQIGPGIVKRSQFGTRR